MGNNVIEIGRLLRASTTGCAVGCKVSQINTPAFGNLVSVPLDDGTQVYGMIYDIHIDDDGLVRQLVTAETIRPEVIEDNRKNRNVPVEISVLFVGYRNNEDKIFHLLPPRPPLSLERLYPCTPDEIVAFTGAGRFGYFRHILRAVDLPISELLAAHLQQAGQAHRAKGDESWIKAATQELITLLRDDYATLNTVLSAVSDVFNS
jgi:hypothetical protein